MQAHYRDYDKMTFARSVAVIHNMAHQGRGPMAELGPLEIPPHYEHLVGFWHGVRRGMHLDDMPGTCHV